MAPKVDISLAHENYEHSKATLTLKLERENKHEEARKAEDIAKQIHTQILRAIDAQNFDQSTVTRVMSETMEILTPADLLASTKTSIRNMVVRFLGNVHVQRAIERI